MSDTRYAQYEIDNDDNLFNFDPYDMLSSRASRQHALAQLVPTHGLNNVASTPSHDAPFTSEEQDEQTGTISNSLDKGKQVSMPMPIRPPAIPHDLFDVSPSNSGAFLGSSSLSQSNFSSFTPSSFTFSSPGSSRGAYEPYIPSSSLPEGFPMDDDGSPSSLTGDIPGKGKGREVPPTLPPLSLGPMELGDHDSWMYFDSGRSAGPSSLNSPGPYSAVSDTPTEDSISSVSLSRSPTTSPTTAETSLTNSGVGLVVPTRSWSVSTVSISSATSSTTVTSKSKRSTTPSNLARKFRFRRRNADDSSSQPTSPQIFNGVMSSQVDTIDTSTVKAVTNLTSPRQWYTKNAQALVSRPPPPSPILALETAITYPANRGVLRHKGRSHSSPLPFSALDVVPVTSTDIFEPLHLFVKNYFDDVLPRELRLRILGTLVQIHVDAHQRMIESERWSVNRASASRNQWIGRDRGIKELIRLSRVSKSWRSLVFDGQLWVDVDIHSFPGLPKETLRRITESAGPFIQTLDVSGLAELDSEKLLDVASNLCLMAPQESLSYTQLKSVNLQGCAGLTTRSLHHLLIRSRSLETLNLRGLSVVTNTTCEILATYCPALTSLNLNRCMNMDAEGIQFMATAAIARGEHLQLKELRVSGLKHTRDSMMEALGKAAPYLEILDLSYARRLHNSALEAFVACDDVDEELLDRLGVPTVMVSARDLGREMTDVCYFRRRVTRLRHLNLSSCILLTDTACTNLAYSVPRLEFFEMAGIGSDLKEAGLIKLFDQTPFIKRIDLEDALDVGDSFLATLTPAPQDQPVGGPSSDSNPPQVGHALQHLNIASALNVRDHGMLSLIRGCPKLIVLEADGTTMSSNVLREFVRLSKERKACDAKIVGVDCRGVGENVVKELAGSTRPRQGWRSYASRRLYYLDSRDGNEEDLKIGQDECDESRVVLKSFYSWQSVDAVKANREKRKKASGGANGRRAGNGSSGSEYDEVSRGGRTRWWSPGGGSRGGSGRTSPLALTEFNEGCRAM